MNSLAYATETVVFVWRGAQGMEVWGSPQSGFRDG